MRADSTCAAPGAARRSTVRGMTTPVVLLPSLGRGASDFDANWSLRCRRRVRGRRARPAPLDARRADVARPGPRGDRRAIDARGFDRVHLLGHAFGQRLARCVVADAPDRVASLTMLAAGGLVHMEPEIATSLRRVLRRVVARRRAPGTTCAACSSPTATTHRVGRRLDARRGAAAAARCSARRRGSGPCAAAPSVLVVQGLQDACAVPENGRRYAAMHPDRVTVGRDRRRRPRPAARAARGDQPLRCSHFLTAA
jgi:pimeloyl-ACP methyl ester carboxylesterase